MCFSHPEANEFIIMLIWKGLNLPDKWLKGMCGSTGISHSIFYNTAGTGKVRLASINMEFEVSLSVKIIITFCEFFYQVFFKT